MKVPWAGGQAGGGARTETSDQDTRVRGVAARGRRPTEEATKSKEQRGC